jgi:hypothetical protein
VKRWAWAILRVTLSHAPAVSDNCIGMAVSMACPHSGRLGRLYGCPSVAAVDSQWHELRLESLTQTGDCVDLPSTLDNVPCTNSWLPLSSTYAVIQSSWPSQTLPPKLTHGSKRPPAMSQLQSQPLLIRTSEPERLPPSRRIRIKHRLLRQTRHSRPMPRLKALVVIRSIMHRDPGRVKMSASGPQRLSSVPPKLTCYPKAHSTPPSS